MEENNHNTACVRVDEPVNVTNTAHYVCAYEPISDVQDTTSKTALACWLVSKKC